MMKRRLILHLSLEIFLNSCVRHGVPFAYVILGDKDEFKSM